MSDDTRMSAAGPAALHVLHVCTGNICRSPMAERIMRAELAARTGPVSDIVVHSAGTYGGHAGGPMNSAAQDELHRRGLDVDAFTSTWLREPQVEWAELVLAATADHKAAVLQLEPRALRRTFTLLELARLAAYVRPDELPAGTPGERLRALAAAAAELRGVHPPGSRTADDIGDPYGESPAVFTETADQIRAAVMAILAPVTEG
jgi:protein-tyrosine phosphatase